MIRIAFCDDERAALDSTEKLLQEYRQARGCEMEICAYCSPLELMAGIEQGRRWDILLLDILMPGENGMELAWEIRSADANARIIFLTSSAEFAVESYGVNAFYYLLKPIRAEALFPVLDRAVESCAQAREEKLILKCKTGIVAVDPEKLRYCEVNRRTLLLHMQDGSLLESRGNLDELEEKLCAIGGFLRAHRSYLVNMAYIRSISYRAIEMDGGVEIAIPHGKYNDVKRIYLAYAFDKERMQR